jgi:hydroxyacylglutathione hydrolase
MLARKYLFPHVIEMNYQAGRRLGVNVYLIDGGSEFLLIDIGFEDTVDEIVDLIRGMDFNLSTCKMLIATHADADHIQGAARAREIFKAKVAAHPLSVGPLERGDAIETYAKISAQGIDLPMPRI